MRIWQWIISEGHCDNPFRTENYEELAKLAAKNSLHLEAVGCYKKMIDLGADKVVTNFLIGKEYYFEGERWRARVDSMMQLQKSNINSDSSEAKKSMILFYTKADSAFTVVTKLNSDYAGGFIWKGRIHATLDPDAITTEAKDAYQNALVLLEKADPEKQIHHRMLQIPGSTIILGIWLYKSDKKALVKCVKNNRMLQRNFKAGSF